MNNEQLASEEVVLKEYPYSTRRMEGQQVIGVGNLILTNERLVFLNRVPLNEEEVEYLQKFSGKATTKRTIDLALALHKKNFQVPLSSVISVKTGLYSIFPFPRPCLRISYRSEKKRKIKAVSFMFTIPIWKGWFQLEITTIKAWGRIIKEAVRYKQSTTSQRIVQCSLVALGAESNDYYSPLAMKNCLPVSTADGC